MKYFIAFICTMFLACPCLSQTPTRTNTEARDSLRGFVQEFYDWYVPKFWKRSPKLAVKIALKQRDYLFRPELARALGDYSMLRRKGRRTIAGSMHDPFLNAGEACERYGVGAISSEGSTYRVSIYPICSGLAPGNSVVDAELARDGKHWVFVNFSYPGEGDLLTHVREIKEANESPLSN